MRGDSGGGGDSGGAVELATTTGTGGDSGSGGVGVTGAIATAAGRALATSWDGSSRVRHRGRLERSGWDPEAKDYAFRRSGHVRGTASELQI